MEHHDHPGRRVGERRKGRDRRTDIDGATDHWHSPKLPRRINGMVSDRRKSDRRAAPRMEVAPATVGAREWRRENRHKFLRGCVEVTNIHGAVLKDFPYLDEDAMLEAYAADSRNRLLDMVCGSLRGYPHAGGDIEIMQEVDRIVQDSRAELERRVAELERRTAEAMRLARDTLAAASKAGMKLVQQPLAEFDDVPLGECFEFENTKATELERRNKELRRYAEHKAGCQEQGPSPCTCGLAALLAGKETGDAQSH